MNVKMKEEEERDGKGVVVEQICHTIFSRFVSAILTDFFVWLGSIGSLALPVTQFRVEAVW